jgi:hypothetical protein
MLVDASVWNTASLEVGTSLFTGVPNLSNLVLTAINPKLTATSDLVPSTSFQNPVGPGLVDGWVGFAGLSGQVKVFALGGISVGVNLSKAGCCQVETGVIDIGIGLINVTYGPWLIGASNSVTMTNLSTNVIQMPGRALGEQTGIPFTLHPSSQEETRVFTTGLGFQTDNTVADTLQIATVVIGGTSNFPSSANGTGTISMVTPLRISTGVVAGTLPGSIRMKFSFVPEPGTLLLLVSGGIGLVLVGRSRLRK